VYSLGSWGGAGANTGIAIIQSKLKFFVTFFFGGELVFHAASPLALDMALQAKVKHLFLRHCPVSGLTHYNLLNPHHMVLV
jgi:hypothetical protein